MASTKDEISRAAQSAFRSVEAAVGTARVTLRELRRSEREALDRANFAWKPDGTGPVVDQRGYRQFLHPDEPVERLHERWIAATIEPAFTVEELADWPASVKRTLYEAAIRVNGIEPADVTAKNS